MTLDRGLQDRYARGGPLRSEETVKFYATDSPQALEAALHHLEKTGYARVDVQKLAEAYEAFQRASRRKIYGSVTFPSLATIRRALDADIAVLAGKKVVQHTVSRVWLLPPKPGELVIRFKLDPLWAPLLTQLDALFPPLAAHP